MAAYRTEAAVVLAEDASRQEGDMTEHEQVPLLELPAPRIGGGAIEAATRKSLEAAGLTDVDAAGAASLLGAAQLLDLELAKGKTYAYAQLFTQWRELLTAFLLTPASRGGEQDDPAAAFLRELTGAGPG